MVPKMGSTLLLCLLLSESRAFNPNLGLAAKSAAHVGKFPLSPSSSSTAEGTGTSLGLTRSSISLRMQMNDDADSKARAGIGAFATLGATETGYLTWKKFFSSTPLLCIGGSGGDCNSVLSGPFSKLPLLGIPLTAVACVCYLTCAALAVAPIFNSGTAGSGGQVGNHETNSKLLLALTTAMATFSAYLMLLLTFHLHTGCTYCFASAGFTFSMAALSWSIQSRSPNLATSDDSSSMSSSGAGNVGGGDSSSNTNRKLNVQSEVSSSAAPSPSGKRGRHNPNPALMVGGSSALATALGSLLIFYSTVALVETPSAQASPEPQQTTVAAVNNALAGATAPPAEPAEPVEKTTNAPPAIKSASSARALALAKRLQAASGRMYGAYWCSHCDNQKQVLGREARQLYTYIECDKEGVDAQRKLCNRKEVPGYPTWELYGQFFPGEKDLSELEGLLDRLEDKYARGVGTTN
jgi:uncharacterized membrane protein